MSIENITLSPVRIAQFCADNGICKFSFFGSVLRDDFHASSDVDVLVEFDTGLMITYLDKARMCRELSGMIGRTVDLRTPSELSPYFRSKVISSASIQYVR